MPRSVSTVISPQIAGPPRSFQPSPHVPTFGSPGCGTDAEAPHQLAGLHVEGLRIAGRADERVLAFASRRGSRGSCRWPAATRSRSRCRRIRRHRPPRPALATGPPPGAAGGPPPARPPRGPRRRRCRRRAVRRRRRLPGMHVGDALVAEALDRLAGRRIERHQLVAGAVEQARAGLVVAGPVRHRAHRAPAHRRLEAPQLLAGLGLERHHAAVLQRDVHRRVDDDRRVLPLAARRLGVELPRLGQARDVLGRDLRQRREARVPGIVAVGRPAVLRDDGRRDARRDSRATSATVRFGMHTLEPLKRS